MILTLGLISAVGILLLLFKCGDIRKVLAFDVPIDIGATIGLSMLFFGTVSGMAIAAVGGLIITIVLFVLKKAIGYKRLTLRGWKEAEPGFLHKMNEERHEQVS